MQGRSTALEAVRHGAGGTERRRRPRLARVADADRERVVQRLLLAVAEGRLTLDEYDDRVGRAYAARRFADFEMLLDDLPIPAPATTATKPDRKS